MIKREIEDAEVEEEEEMGKLSASKNKPEESNQAPEAEKENTEA